MILINKFVKKEKKPINRKAIKLAYAERAEEIRERLADFDNIWKNGSDLKLWEEMVYCFFTGGCSAKMGLNSIEAVRPLLMDGSHEELTQALLGKHRYPNARSRYVAVSREFLIEHCGMRLREKLDSFECDLERRDWLVKEKGIKGLGYKEASHYLRNIGLKGYAILDKHVLNCMTEMKLIDDPKPPNTRSKYLMYEQHLKKFADQIKIDFEELDLVLWSMKTGEILK